LQQKLDLALNGTLTTVIKELSAIAALEEKGVTLRNIAKMGLQSNDLMRVHQRRKFGEFLDCFSDRLWVGVIRRLLDGL